jgi:hypothetical protein
MHRRQQRQRCRRGKKGTHGSDHGGNGDRVLAAASVRVKNDNTVGGHGDLHIDQVLLTFIYVRAGAASA